MQMKKTYWATIPPIHKILDVSWLLLQNINSFSLFIVSFVYRKRCAFYLSTLTLLHSISNNSFCLESYSFKSHVCYIFVFRILWYRFTICHCIFIINDIHIVRAGKSSMQPYSFNNNKNNNNNRKGK